MKTVAIFLCFVLLTVACNSNENNVSEKGPKPIEKNEKKRLAASKWVVEKVNVEMKDKYMQLDSMEAKAIRAPFLNRIYSFTEEGKFTISNSEKPVTGTWNLGKDDKDPLYHDLGTKQTTVVMRSTDGTFEEMWMPIAGETIFVNYSETADKDYIDAVIVPSPVSGVIVYVYLKREG